jgi:CTP synthase (UTP-ammonia lyase)
VEYARNVLDISDAEHEETSPRGSNLVISKLGYSLVGATQTVKIRTGTLTHEAYGTEEAVEQFRCSYGLNHVYQRQLETGSLKVVGAGPDGEARIVELSGHLFFLATLFLPQLYSSAGMPHPLITSFLKAVAAFEPSPREAE